VDEEIYRKESILHLENGESLKSRNYIFSTQCSNFCMILAINNFFSGTSTVLFLTRRKRKSFTVREAMINFVSFLFCCRHKGFLKDCPNGLLTEQVSAAEGQQGPEL
jgi:hypothetical protein